MKLNRIIRNLFQASLFSVAGLALLTQTASAGEMKNTGNAEDLQGVVACNVAQNPWLSVAPIGELPCEFPIGGSIDTVSLGLEQEIMQLDETIKDVILYHRDRSQHPNALVVSDR